MTEQWRAIVGWPGYSVSSLGRVLGKRGNVLLATVSHDGYLYVSLSDAPRVVKRKVHQLVIEAFLHERPAGMEVRHLDDDKTNNSVGNLVYGTQSENTLDMVAAGVHKEARKTHCPQGHEYTPDNLVKSKRGKRDCAECNRQRARAAWLRGRPPGPE